MKGQRPFCRGVSRKPRTSVRNWCLAGVGLSLLTSVAQARVQSSSIIDTTVLHSAKAPAARSVPVRQPYFLGWSASVPRAEGILQPSKQNGGVAIDTLGKSVYAGTSVGRVVCLGPGGETRWNVDVGGAVLAPPTVFGELVLVGTSEGVLHVLNKVTGERYSRAILGEELITQPVVVETPEGQRIAYVGSSGESVFAVDIETGQRLWRSHRDAPSGFTVFGFARPVVTEKAVFVAYADGVVEARDPATGVLEWEKRVSPPGDLLDVDSLAFNGQTLFAASFSGGVYALTPDSGAIVWRGAMTGANHVVSDGHMVYVGAPGEWSAFRAVDGVLGWRFKLDNDSASTDAVIADRFLVFAESDGPLYFVDKRTGEPAGALGTGGGFSSPPAAAGPILVALSNGGQVYTLTVVP